MKKRAIYLYLATILPPMGIFGYFITHLAGIVVPFIAFATLFYLLGIWSKEPWDTSATEKTKRGNNVL